MAEMKLKFKCRCQNCHVYSLGLIRMLPIAMVSNVHVCWVGGGASKTSLRAGKIIQDKPMLTSISFFPFFLAVPPACRSSQSQGSNSSHSSVNARSLTKRPPGNSSFYYLNIKIQGESSLPKISSIYRLMRLQTVHRTVAIKSKTLGEGLKRHLPFPSLACS